MATHDYVLANQSGSSFRSDLNNALAAIVSSNSSATEPATPYAYQYWIDTSATPELIKQRNSTNDGWITLGEVNGQTLVSDGTVAKPGISFASDINTGIYRPAADQVAIGLGGAEIARFKSTAFLVGTTDVSPGFGNTSTGASMSAARIGASRDDNSSGYFNRNGTNGNAVTLRKDGAVVGSISVTASATAYNTSSDYRLKENVVPLTGSIDRVKALKPYRFNFIVEPDVTVDGFLAHEAQSIVPECVEGEKDAIDEDGNPEYQGIDQSKLVPLLTGALQEALTRIEELETKVAALEAAN